MRLSPVSPTAASDLLSVKFGKAVRDIHALDQVAARPPQPPPQIACGALPDPSGLLASIILNPEEDTPRLMYADWLEEHQQEERAELIRKQIGLSAIRPGPGRDLTHAKCTFLVNTFQWFGGLIPRVVDRGFLTHISCSWYEWDEHGDALRSREWVPLVKLTTRPEWEWSDGVSDIYYRAPKPYTRLKGRKPVRVHWEMSLEPRLRTVLESTWPGTAFEMPA